MSAYTITFNAVDIASTPGLRVVGVNTLAPSQRALSIANIARRSTRKTSAAFYAARQLVVTIEIQTNNRTLLEQSMDYLNSILQTIEGQLTVSQSGAIRTFTCTHGAFVINETYGGYISLDILFECSDSFGYAQNSVILLNAVRTTGLNNDSIILGGSSQEQVPIYTYTLASVTGGTGAWVQVGNNNSGQAVKVTRNWSNGDVLTVDNQNLLIQVNGVDVDFTGAVPITFALGLQTSTYQDNFTTRRYTLNATHFPRYV